MVLELELESMHGLLESESHEAQIGVVIEIKLLGKHTLESESLATGIGIRTRISSTGIEMQWVSRVPKSFTALVCIWPAQKSSPKKPEY